MEIKIANVQMKVSVGKAKAVFVCVGLEPLSSGAEMMSFVTPIGKTCNPKLSIDVVQSFDLLRCGWFYY